MTYQRRCKPEDYEFYDNDDWLHEDDSGSDDGDSEEEEEEEEEDYQFPWMSETGPTLASQEQTVKNRWDYVFDSLAWR